MTQDYTYADLLLLKKKDLVIMSGYPNMKALCKAMPSLTQSNKKGPSHKTLARILS